MSMNGGKDILTLPDKLSVFCYYKTYLTVFSPDGAIPRFPSHTSLQELLRRRGQSAHDRLRQPQIGGV